MELKKSKGAYDKIIAELSYLELLSFRDGARKLGGPVADEAARAIDWYLANEHLAPGEVPGNEKKDDAASAEADGVIPDVGGAGGPDLGGDLGGDLGAGGPPGEPGAEGALDDLPGGEPDATVTVTDEVDKLIPDAAG